MVRPEGNGFSLVRKRTPFRTLPPSTDGITQRQRTSNCADRRNLRPRTRTQAHALEPYHGMKVGYTARHLESKQQPVKPGQWHVDRMDQALEIAAGTVLHRHRKVAWPPSEAKKSKGQCRDCG